MIGEPVHRSVLTAQPGWTVVVPDDGGLYRMPVIAWLCEVYLMARPEEPGESLVNVTAITCNGSVGDLATYAYQRGEDAVFYTYDEVFEGEATLLAFFSREEEQQRRRWAPIERKAPA